MTISFKLGEVFFILEGTYTPTFAGTDTAPPDIEDFEIDEVFIWDQDGRMTNVTSLIDELNTLTYRKEYSNCIWQILTERALDHIEKDE